MLYKAPETTKEHNRYSESQLKEEVTSKMHVSMVQKAMYICSDIVLLNI